jgi:hypothetical protein
MYIEFTIQRVYCMTSGCQVISDVHHMWISAVYMPVYSVCPLLARIREQI